ncbi:MULTISPECIES: type III secretion system HrpP C-terminal domain-containing protein [unclassified Pseudomonas]|uniref:type III secretion system HrpP C-terminal domain-containing protein n=1 Tax=unclassified Pseudomonas TaxID=196821 RepID=UPI000D36C3A0|nr:MULTISPECIES: type III secretion system HrpP C-terminal domain-containing protein [unclassified Pseudomonas]RAU38190.1 flagellar hook-length control protein FliK [Pseudomonas sp. RIT 409]RAU45053.1 flagellar hook-length control protein FliK [Pseudomonas sp. RIT 412]
MNTPIKAPPRPAPPTPQRPAQAEFPGPSDKRPALSVRRGDLDRLRSFSDESRSGEAVAADGLFFSQLLVPSVDEAPDHSGFGGGSLFLAQASDSVPTQLVDELAQRLPLQPDGPFNVTLLMPHLGRVQVNANKRDNQWNIELAFARRGALKRLQPHQRACEQALTDALGQDVALSFEEGLPA